MIKCLIPQYTEFNLYKQECNELYSNLQKDIGDTNSFEFVVNNTFFYIFVNEDGFIGSIYYFVDEAGKLFLNAFAKRKKHLLCLECLKMSLNWFKPPIYAYAQNRASALCLLRCGFKRDKGNVFGYFI